MELAELKDIIESGADFKEGQVWLLKHDTSRIIADQYIKIYAEKHMLVPIVIDSYKDIQDDAFLVDDSLYVLVTDKLTKPNNYLNCIVLCKSVAGVRGAIEFPGLKDWQVLDFATALVPGVSKADLEWLLTQYGEDYRKYLMDLDRLTTVAKSAQQEVYNQMFEEGQFSSHTSLTVWDLVGGVVKRDKELVKEALKNLPIMGIEPLGLLTLICRDFKNVINIQFNPSATAESTGLQSKQFYAIKKYSCGKYTNAELIHIYSLLTDIENKFKFEGLDIDKIIDYIIINILGV